MGIYPKFECNCQEPSAHIQNLNVTAQESSAHIQNLNEAAISHRRIPKEGTAESFPQRLL